MREFDPSKSETSFRLAQEEECAVEARDTAQKVVGLLNSLQANTEDINKVADLTSPHVVVALDNSSNLDGNFYFVQPVDQSTPAQITIEFEGLHLPFASLSPSKRDDCGYVQVGQTISDESIVTTRNDILYRSQVRALRNVTGSGCVDKEFLDLFKPVIEKETNEHSREINEHKARVAKNRIHELTILEQAEKDEKQIETERFVGNIVENIGQVETVVQLMNEGEVSKNLRIFRPEGWSTETKSGRQIQLALSGTLVQPNKLNVSPDSLEVIALTRGNVAISLGSIHELADDIKNLEESITESRKSIGYPVSGDDGSKLRQYADDFDRDSFAQYFYSIYGYPTISGRLGALVRRSLNKDREHNYPIGKHEVNLLVNHAVARHYLGDEAGKRIPAKKSGLYYRLTLETVDDYFYANGSHERYTEISNDKMRHFTPRMNNHLRLTYWLLQYNHLNRYLSGSMFKKTIANPSTISLAEEKFTAHLGEYDETTENLIAKVTNLTKYTQPSIGIYKDYPVGNTAVADMLLTATVDLSASGTIKVDLGGRLNGSQEVTQIFRGELYTSQKNTHVALEKIDELNDFFKRIEG